MYIQLNGATPEERTIDAIRTIKMLAGIIARKEQTSAITAALKDMRTDRDVKVIMGQLPSTHDDAFHF